MNTYVYNSLGELCHAAANRFVRLIDGSNISIVVPGGNTPRKFFHNLAQQNINWEKICLILSDERMVSVSHQASNYGMINEMLIENLPNKNKPKVVPDMEKFAETDSERFLYETNLYLKERLPIRHAFLGIGSDGHTASLFPGNEMVSLNGEPFFYTVNKDEPYQRMTLSLDFLEKILDITFIVSGKSKYSSLKAILDGTIKDAELPVHQLIDKIDNAEGKATILCDRDSWPIKVYA